MTQALTCWHNTSVTPLGRRPPHVRTHRRKKNRWKDRLSQRIDRRIETVTAEDPHLLDRVHEQARQHALESLGLADIQRDLGAVRKEQEKLGTREDALKSQLIARVRGVPVSQVGSTYLCDTEVSNAIKTRVEVHGEQSMMQSDLGRRIVDLRREKDNLLDVVWLATSSVQIKELWGKLAKLLGDETTRLEREAMVIAPVVD